MASATTSSYGISGTVVDAKLVALYVEALKDAYYILRRRIRPDFRGLGDRHNARIAVIAESLVEGKGDPYAYMQFVFDRMAAHGPDVHVNMFCSGKMVNRFLESRPERMRRLETIVKGLARNVQIYRREGRTTREILEDLSLPLSDVFCYALAYSEGHLDIAAKLEKSARRMLIFEPYYKTLLGKWLPDRMRNV